MKVKKYEASSIAEALAKVKGDLGPDAVILHTRSFRRGGIMGFMARNVVEITASDTVNIQERRQRRASAAAKRNDDSGEFASPVSRSATALAEAPAKKSAHALNRLYGLESKAPAAPAQRETFSSTREMARAALQDPAFEIRSEIASLRTMVESLLQRDTSSPNSSPRRPDLPDELAKAYLSLLEQQVAEEIALNVVRSVKDELTGEQLANPITVRERLVNKLSQLIPAKATSEVARPVTGQGCRSICLVGPTGVGKTTTIAKLAAAFKLRQKLSVGLITIDTYRIAAVDQLRTYANIIGALLKFVLTPAELKAALADMASCDVVLIDTAGRAPTDELKLNELANFIQTANPTEVHLVLSSTCTQTAMESALARFGKIRVDQIIFTKLDEAVSFGVLLNIARKASKALSYLTTGQDVPDHVEPGQPRRLAKLILGEKL